MMIELDLGNIVDEQLLTNHSTRMFMILSTDYMLTRNFQEYNQIHKKNNEICSTT